MSDFHDIVGDDLNQVIASLPKEIQESFISQALGPSKGKAQMALKVNRPIVQAAAPVQTAATTKPAAQAVRPGLTRPSTQATQVAKPVTQAAVATKPVQAAAKPQQTQVSAQSKPVDQLSKQLTAMKDRWNKAKTESAKGGGGGGTTLSASPKGERHICQLSAAKCITGDKGVSVLLEWTCVEGQEIGEKAVQWLNFDTDEKFIWSQRILRKLEVDVDLIDDPAMLPQLCVELVEAAPAARITVKENGEYTNVYIDKLVVLEGQSTEVQAGQELPPSEGSESPGEAQAEPGTEDVAETAVETEAPTDAENGEAGEVVEGLTVGDDVEYTIKGKPQTGVVKAIMDDDTVNVRNDVTKAIENVDLIKIRKLTAT